MVQSVNHFNMFANSAELTRLLLGKTHRAHDEARSNKDGLCHEPEVLLGPAYLTCYIRARFMSGATATVVADSLALMARL